MKKASLFICLGLSTMLVFAGCSKAETHPVPFTYNDETDNSSEEPDKVADEVTEEREKGPDFSSIQVGQKIEFGSYNQGEDGVKPIEWLVLDIKDDRALITSMYCLDRVKYNQEEKESGGTQDNAPGGEAPNMPSGGGAPAEPSGGDAPNMPSGGGEQNAETAPITVVEEIPEVTWENSTIRLWLNRMFYNTAFSSAEQSIIEETEIINNANPTYGTPGGNATTDKVFLLSIDEAKQYFETPDLRRCQYVGSGYCWYYLRSPGEKSDKVAYVSFYGDIVYEGVEADSFIVFHIGDDQIDYGDNAVRPAMWIKINQ